MAKKIVFAVFIGIFALLAFLYKSDIPFEELKNNVSWPAWPEAQSLTILVAVFSIIFSLAIWGVDTVFSKVIGYYFTLING